MGKNEGGIYSYNHLQWNTRVLSNKPLTMHLVSLGKQEEAKLQISKWKETAENRTKTNEVETKMQQGSNEANN